MKKHQEDEHEEVCCTKKAPTRIPCQALGSASSRHCKFVFDKVPGRYVSGQTPALKGSMLAANSVNALQVCRFSCRTHGHGLLYLSRNQPVRHTAWAAFKLPQPSCARTNSQLTTRSEGLPCTSRLSFRPMGAFHANNNFLPRACSLASDAEVRRQRAKRGLFRQEVEK